MTIGEVGERLRRATAHIRTEGARHAGAGSGIVLRESGAILTNAHVIGGGSKVTVELWDGRVFPARVHAADAIRDLALLRIDAAGLPALEFRGTPARAGETAIAVGNPMGFTGAMSSGVVRGVGPIPRLGRREWVQTTIRLAPGNSGGPLADAEGRLIGVNTMVMSGRISLAIPAAAARAFAERGPTPKLGITVHEVASGLLVMEIEPNSVAEQASLLIGDVLTALNGRNLQNYEDLADGLAASGAIARIGFLRGGAARRREVAVHLRARAAA
jgi:serine protease Do